LLIIKAVSHSPKLGACRFNFDKHIPAITPAIRFFGGFQVSQCGVSKGHNGIFDGIAATQTAGIG